MTPDDAQLVLNLCDSYWPGMARNWPPELVDAWRKELALLDFDTADKTLAAMVHNGQRFRPDVGQFAEAYKIQARATLTPTAERYREHDGPRSTARPPFEEWRAICVEARARRTRAS